LICFTIWLDVSIKWSFGFPFTFINKLKMELENRSHTPLVDHRYFCETWGVCM
jgi:hypothetical protein